MTTRNKTMTTRNKTNEVVAYGIKWMSHGHARIMTASNGWMSHRFVGIGAYNHKEWKTRHGAQRAADRCNGSNVIKAEVFEITAETMNY